MKWLAKGRHRKNLKKLSDCLRRDHMSFHYDSSSYLTCVYRDGKTRELTYSWMVETTLDSVVRWSACVVRWSACGIGYGGVIGIGVPIPKCVFGWREYQHHVYGIKPNSLEYNFLFHPMWSSNGDTALMLADRIEYYLKYGVDYGFAAMNYVFDATPSKYNINMINQSMKDWIVSKGGIALQHDPEGGVDSNAR